MSMERKWPLPPRLLLRIHLDFCSLLSNSDAGRRWVYLTHRRSSLCSFTSNCLPCLLTASTRCSSSSHRLEGSRQSIIRNTGHCSVQSLPLLMRGVFFKSVIQLLPSRHSLFPIPETGVLPMGGVFMEPQILQVELPVRRGIDGSA